MRVIVLGCGGSSGTPAIDWGWGACDPGNPRNRRTRPSIVVEAAETRLLIDTAPELRQQLLDAGISTLSAVLYTHAHADHVHGIDDLRAINRRIGAPLDVYGDDATLARIEKRFGYAFAPLPAGARSYYKPTLMARSIADGDEVRIGAISVTAFAQDHGFSTTLGFRFEAGGVTIAYSTDVVELPESAGPHVSGLDLWIIGTFVDEPHATHCHVAKALAWIERWRPRRAVLTHLGCSLDYARLAAALPAGVEPAFDGMRIAIGRDG